jgi:hypothetical protein
LTGRVNAGCPSPTAPHRSAWQRPPRPLSSQSRTPRTEDHLGAGSTSAAPLINSPHVRRRTNGTGGFFLVSIWCSFRRSPSSRRRPIMFSGICRVLSWSSLCPDTNSRSRSAPASAAFRRAWRRPLDSITITPAARPSAVGQPEQGHRVSLVRSWRNSPPRDHRTPRSSASCRSARNRSDAISRELFHEQFSEIGSY